MKVLAIVPDYIEKPSGGLGEQFRNISKCLDGRVEYYVAGYPEKNNLKNYKSVTSPFPFPHTSLTTVFGQVMYFMKGIEFKEEFDIIHAYDWSVFYAGYLCKLHLNKPLVCTLNLSLKQLNKEGIFYCMDPKTVDGISINQVLVNYEKLGLINANKVIQVSNYYADLYPEHSNKTTVIPNGLDINQWQRKRDPNLPGKNKLKFCYIGRASAMKGLDIILQCNIPDDIDFYFVVSPKNAEEPLFSYIKSKCNNKNIFHIPGLYSQDKMDFLYAMDGVVMPSSHEPFGIVALEALISENLFITTAAGGIKEIVDGIDYFKISSSTDLLKTFKQIQNLSDIEKTLILNKGKERALKYSWFKSADQLYNVYKELI